MNKHNVKIIIIGMLLAIAMSWGVINYLPSMLETENYCIAPKVIDDMSQELLTCYENIDRCNKYFEACVNVYLNQHPESAVP